MITSEDSDVKVFQLNWGVDLSATGEGSVSIGQSDNIGYSGGSEGDGYASWAKDSYPRLWAGLRSDNEINGQGSVINLLKRVGTGTSYMSCGLVPKRFLKCKPQHQGVT